jgi:hypothetical protein
MSTITAIDYRRTDVRSHTWLNSWWITSAIMVGADCEDKGAILFSFPKVKKYFVEQVVVQITTAFTASTTLNIGSGTIATDAITTGGDVTIVDEDEYLLSADLTVATIGWYGSTTANTSDWLAAKILGSYVAPYTITGAASTTPVIYASWANAGTILAGKARVHVMLTEVPGY